MNDADLFSDLALDASPGPIAVASPLGRGQLVEPRLDPAGTEGDDRDEEHEDGEQADDAHEEQGEHGFHAAQYAPETVQAEGSAFGDYAGPQIPDGYADRVRLRVEAYVSAILGGKLRVNLRIRQAAERWNRYLADPRFRMDWEAGARVVYYLETLHLSDQGEPVRLIEWQAWHAAACYGLRWAADGRRVIRLSVVQVARGAGKSTYCGGLVCYEFQWGGRGSRIYVIANKIDQAKIVFAAADNAFRSTYPDLHEECGRHNRFVDADRNVEFSYAIAKDKTLDGLKPRLWIGDEASEWRGRFLTKVTTAANKMPVSLGVIVTTPGDNKDLIYTSEVVDLAHRVLDGELDLPTNFYLLFGLDEEDDLEDEAAWWKANPGFPSVPPLASLRDAWQEMRLSPVKRGEFARFHGARFSSQANRWLDMTYWDEASDSIPLSEMKGRPAWLGLDLSKAFDLCALVAAVPLDDGRVALYGRYWWPRESALNREVEWSVPLRKWESEGRIVLTPGRSIAYQPILDELLGLRRLLDVRKLLFDPWNAGYFAETLISEHGYPAEQYRLTDANFVPGCQEFQQMWVRRAFVHGNCPILRRCCADAGAKEFSNGYARIIKSSKRAIIDGLVSSVLAVHGWCAMRNQHGSSYGVAAKQAESSGEAPTILM
jgi:phage terminase large subunit-like protein